MDDVSLAIRQEIHRFESVHPSVYALYELTEALPNFAVPVHFQDELRRHIVTIEGLSCHCSCVIAFKVSAQGLVAHKRGSNNNDVTKHRTARTAYTARTARTAL